VQASASSFISGISGWYNEKKKFFEGQGTTEGQKAEEFKGDVIFVGDSLEEIEKKKFSEDTTIDGEDTSTSEKLFMGDSLENLKF
jgi:hypothetical protein